MTPFWRRIGSLAAAGVAAVLAACGDGPASNVSYKLGPQVWDFFLFAAKDGPVLVVADGNPFEVDDDALVESIAASMQAGFTEPFIKFTTAPAQAAHADYRMIWTLNPAPGYDMNTVCERRPAAAEHLTGGRLEMRVAFCQAGRLLAAVHGWMPAADAGPDNGDWRDLVTQMARQLVSTEGL